MTVTRNLRVMSASLITAHELIRPLFNYSSMAPLPPALHRSSMIRSLQRSSSSSLKARISFSRLLHTTYSIHHPQHISSPIKIWKSKRASFPISGRAAAAVCTALAAFGYVMFNNDNCMMKTAPLHTRIQSLASAMAYHTPSLSSSIQQYIQHIHARFIPVFSSTFSPIHLDLVPHSASPTVNDDPIAFRKALSAILSPDQIDDDQGERLSRAKPCNSYHAVRGVPRLILYPETTEQVAAIVRVCGKYGVSIVPYGGGTSLEGHTLAIPTGRRDQEGQGEAISMPVSLDLNRMNKIIALHEHDLDVTVQAGVGYIQLNQWLQDHHVSHAASHMATAITGGSSTSHSDYQHPRLWFPLDPGPGASIGGMCACRCSGSTAVKYGSMRENVLSVVAVMADGQVVKTGHRARKSSAGYDLTRLLIGSEGTLAIITEVTLKLHTVPKYSYAMRISFPDVKSASMTARDTLRSGINIGRCELLDQAMVRIINEGNGHGAESKEFFTSSDSGADSQISNNKGINRAAEKWQETTTLLYEVVGISDSSVREQLDHVQAIAAIYGGNHTEIFTSEKDCADLWRCRKECAWTVMAAYPDREAMITDVCVPLTNLPKLISDTRQVLDASFLPAPMLAHAGDGNFHVLIMFRPDREDEMKEAKRLSEDMARRAIEMDGTCTGEHGIGVGKMHLLKEEMGPGSMSMMKKLKVALDPYGIFNPGKVVD